MSDSKPPSRRRYERENPTVSFRVSREIKEKLDRLVDDLGTTKKDWFEGVIEEERGRFSAAFEQGKTKGKKEGFDKGYEEGYDEGRHDGYREFVTTVPCLHCGEPVPVNTEERMREVFKAIERMNQDWTALPPPGTLSCDIHHDQCPSSSE